MTTAKSKGIMTRLRSETDRELVGKRALVTGGTRGIEAVIVGQLLDAGAEVMTTARSSTSAIPTERRFRRGRRADPCRRGSACHHRE